MSSLFWFLLFWLGQHTERPDSGEPVAPVKPVRFHHQPIATGCGLHPSGFN